jgi:hydrogenase-4 component B
MSFMTPLAICLVSVAILAASALSSMLLTRAVSTSRWVATLGCVLACIVGLASSVTALLREVDQCIRLGWNLPVGAFHVGLDPVSAFFLLVLFLVSAITSIYAAGYAHAHGEHDRAPLQLGWSNLMVASMVVILLARDAILFLMAWEAMAIVSFFLVTTEHEREDVRRAGYIYLVASHLGTLFVFLLFAWLYRNTGSLDFDVWASLRGTAMPYSSLAFVLAIIGFGTKAGIWPLHIWLPYAHPAAPSPVSAMMSGVMIKMGIYGIIRSLLFLGPPAAWWGALLIVVGILSGVVGVLLALAQHDLKRLLAYHSVENIGIIALGMGVGLLGQSQGQSAIAFLGFAGAMLHVLNHALFKGLLFQAAGCVLLQTGQRDVNVLGGLSKRMPATSALFLVASIAICGLPPLNGFVSEWLIYSGAFRCGGLPSSRLAVLAIAAITSLALIGGLALACFTKAQGIVFLGEPRSPAADRAHEVGALMLGPMVSLALSCAAIGLFPLAALRLVAPAVRIITGGTPVSASAMTMVGTLSLIALVVFGLVASLLLLRMLLLRRRVVTRAATWGCGYPVATPRMQYSAGSFAAPVLATFHGLVAARECGEMSTDIFPVGASRAIKYRDVAADWAAFPLAAALYQASARLRVLQQGRIQLYLVYLFVTLISLLFWQLIPG